MTEIDYVDQQIGFVDFFQRRFERFNQSVRQFSQKTDGIGEQNPLFVRQRKAARRRIERGESLSSVKTPAPVRRFNKVDFPALVYPTTAATGQ